MASGGGKRLSFSPTGCTPQPKKSRNSGRQAKLIQSSLQAQLKQLLEYSEGSKMWILELEGRLGGSYAKGSILYALKQCFPEFEYNSRKCLLNGVKFKSDEQLASELACDTEDKSTQTHHTQDCDCLDNTIQMLVDELQNLSKKERPSVLRTEELHLLTVENIEAEFQERTPTLLKLLMQTIRKGSRKVSRQKEIGILTVICKLANVYNIQLNALSKINGLRLKRAGVPKRTIFQFNKTYDSVSYFTVNRLLDSYSDKADQRASQWAGLNVHHCGDNVDINMKARHELQDNLSDTPPHVPSIADTDFSQFIPNHAEQKRFLNALEQQVTTSWKLVEGLQSIATEAAGTSYHSYSPEMKSRTEKAHIGVLLKNESSTPDVIDILDYCKKYPSENHTERAVYRGDYATYERVKQALSVMANVPDYFKFIPTFADFHLQMRWSKAIMDRFFDPASCRDTTSLAALRAIMNSKQVNKDVNKNYHAITLFLDKVLDSHLMLYGQQMLGDSQLTTEKSSEIYLFEVILGLSDSLYNSSIINVDRGDEQLKQKAKDLLQMLYASSTTAAMPESGCPHCGKAYRLHRNLSNHMKECHPGATATSQPNQPRDQLHSHTKELLKMLLIKRLLDHSIKVGDGNTLCLVIKHMLLYFKTLGCTKYAVAVFEFIAQQQIFLSDKMATLVRQERFVNNAGRANSNIPIDLDIEHSNKFFKENFSLASGELSQRVVHRLSKSQDIVANILSSFESSFGLEHFDPVRAVNKEKYVDDISKLAKHLSASSLFTIDSSRKLFSSQLCVASQDIVANIDLLKLKYWLSDRLVAMMDQPWYKY